MTAIIGILAFIILGPIIGGLLAGADRVLTARMQSRKGPPLLQPFYDVLKLWGKRGIVANRFQSLYIWSFLLFVIIAGAVFFSGGDLLVCVFALTVAGVFLTVAAHSANSPYRHIGAERELLQMMSYEPMLIIAVLGFYLKQVFGFEDNAHASLPEFFEQHKSFFQSGAGTQILMTIGFVWPVNNLRD